MIRRVFAIASVLVSLAGIARADITADEILKFAKEPTSITHMAGIIAGIQAVNGQLEYNKQPVLFCQPDQLSLTVDQDMEIVRGFLSRHPQMGRFPIGVVFLYALIETFPCK